MTAVDPQGEQAKEKRRVQAEVIQEGGRTGRRARDLAALGLAALLAGCGGNASGSVVNTPPGQQQAPPCPRVAVLADAAHYGEFRSGSRDPSDMVLQADLTGIRGECSFPRSLSRVTVDMSVLMVAGKGPAAAADTAQLTYFVAVVDSAKQVRARQEFTLPVTFPPGQTRVALSDDLSEQIPLPQGAAAASFEVLVGFKLTPEQLERNRSNPAPRP